jgi:acetyltransferase
MSVHGLERLLAPQRIALIGVTINPESVGGIVLANLVGGAFRGTVYPINPSAESVLGVPCFDDVRELPRTPDLAIICSGAADVPAQVRACGEAGVGGVIVMSAGFGEAGEAGAALQVELEAAIAANPQMRVLGPNCLGIVVPGLSLNASFARVMPKKGHVAFISQSGALCTSVLDWAREEKVGFSAFVSVGNALDVDIADLIDYFGEDDDTESIILYIESIGDARAFLSALRSYARTKPIIIYKAGRFPQSAAVAASHTGALVSEDAVYDAAFQRAGVARVMNIGEIFDCAMLVGRKRIPAGPRLGIVTNAGGPGVMAVDALIANGGELAQLSEESMAGLDACLPPMWSHANPVDVLGDARAKRFEKAARIVVADPGVDALLVILTPQGMTRPDRVGAAIGKLVAETNKPVLAAWLGRESVREGQRILVDAGAATYDTPEQAVRAFMTLVDYKRNLENLHETPRDVRIEFGADKEALGARIDSLCTEPATLLSETDTKALLQGYGLATASPEPAADAEAAVSIAEKMGYPVVLKIDSPDITHKTDVGGVALDLIDAADVRKAFGAIMSSAAEAMPEAHLRGVIVQPMIDAKDGVELILGLKRDPVFGTVVMAGVGGTAAEVWKDSALGFPPLNERLARRMLESLTIWPLLQGYRGRPPVDLDALIETLIRFSYLAADMPQIEELDVNPLLCSATGVTALDARAVAGPAQAGDRPYAHLALRPYPEELVQTVKLPSGLELRLRPIRPEDEARWLELLGGCSKESIYSRFRFFFNWSTHEAAVRYCYIDYDREIAMVAETGEGDDRKLVGVGRLIAEPGLQTAEYAVLVQDGVQNIGLGGMLTDVCMEIARDWGIKRVVAETTTSNQRMVKVFSSRGFEIATPQADGTVEVSKGPRH